MGAAWPRRLGASSLAAALIPILAATAAAATSPTSRCSHHKRDRSRCLQVVVPLDRSGALPGTIGLRVRVLPSLTPQPSETVLALAGGPGQAAAPLLELFDLVLGERTMRSRRLVAFDQRGTGRSGRLRCPQMAPLVEQAVLDPAEAVQRAVAACAAQLGPARAHYATADSVADVEAVRAVLGVDRLVLYGTSYGTKVALDYAAAYPQHVSRLILDSVVEPGGIDPFERMTIGSIPRVLRAFCGHDCSFTRDPVGDLDALAGRLAHGPLRGRWVDGRGHPRQVALERRDLFPLLLDGDFDRFERKLLPGAVHSAVEGDPAMLLRLSKALVGTATSSGGDSDALYLATICADGGVPWEPGTPIPDRSAAVAATLAAIPSAQLAPFGADGAREIGLADLCRAWPEAPVVQSRSPLPALPTLILSGDEDLRTPRANALAVARQIPGAHVVTVPHTGHSVLGAELGNCARRAVAAFLADRSPRACRAARLSVLAPEDVPPRSLPAVRQVPGLPPHAGRTVAAVERTIDAMGTQFAMELGSALLAAGKHWRALRFGGLRAGSLTITQNALIMRRYSTIPGVTLSTYVPDDSSDRSVPMRVGGSVAAHGLLRIGERWIVGRLGGRRVRVRVKVADRSAGIARASRVAARTSSAPPAPPMPAALRALLDRL